MKMNRQLSEAYKTEVFNVSFPVVQQILPSNVPPPSESTALISPHQILASYSHVMAIVGIETVWDLVVGFIMKGVATTIWEYQQNLLPIARWLPSRWTKKRLDRPEVMVLVGGRS